jgi:predicted RNase H-like nuclease
VDAERVLGVDACKTGWVGIALGDHGLVPYFAAHIDELLTAADNDGPIQVVGIDMPIGLPDSGVRQADLLARLEIGVRRSSVFMTPVRAALHADTHARAVEINRRVTGHGISIQAFALKSRLLEVDAWVRQAPHRVVEVHPEVSFARLAGRHLRSAKSTWAGAETRRQLLAAAGIHLTGDLGVTGAAAKVDDILDAAAAAWTARRVLRGQARSLPDPPQTFSDGLPSAIWT